ncbi:unnamed protein product [Rhizoctonia solani]|uniref:CHAT domain-containing protein n=1 Tax=Rhizoctonia solani TaxID=456999 RepID=A0A8H3DTC0_9AGAM|nr:unnamed protein product [Rhizoctonia solani]
MEHTLEEIDKEIQAISRALSVTPSDHPNAPPLLAGLGKAYNKRSIHRGELDDIQKAVHYLSIALYLTSENDPGLPALLSALGIAHNQRFQRLGDINDIELAIGCKTRGLSMTPHDHPDLSRRLASLGVAHRDRFECVGELGDITKMIEYHSRAITITPKDNPGLCNWFAELGTSYRYRFERLGELEDIDKAIEHQSQGISSAKPNHPHLGSMLANLGASHNLRLHRLGELGDLEKAIEYNIRALALTPAGHPHVRTQLANLGTFHTERFRRLNRQDDLDKAIDCKSRALDLSPDGHIDVPTWLHSLAMSHHARFELLNDLEDLKKAIEYQSRALFLTSDGHPGLSGRLAHLAVYLKSRFECVHEVADLDQAIECESRALALIPDDHPDFGSRHFNRAISYVRYYEHTSDPSYLKESLASFRISCMPLTGAARGRFLHAHSWAKVASTYSSLNSIEAYHRAIDLLPQFVWLGATSTQRYEDLKMIETLPVDAATVAISFLDYYLALEWLEHSRCVVWNQNLMLRSPLNELQEFDPVLARRLETITKQLHSASSESRELRAMSSGEMTPEQVAQEHRRLAEEYNKLLAQTRALPGFEDFLQPIKANRLVHAPRTGPIVIINCHKDRCDALLIKPGQASVNHIPLPNFNAEKAQHARSQMEISIQGRHSRERGVTRRPQLEVEENNEFESTVAALWDDVVKPILDSLGFTNSAPGANLPHVTWCPTGPMSFLPLHAAGKYDQPLSKVFNYVISSYIPTLNALLESTPHTLGRDSRVLAIGQTATPGHSALPGTAMELESVKAHVQGKTTYLQLVDDQATTTDALNAMEQCDWVHLACHAHQNVGSATESGFFLHDGVLDLASINRRSLKNKGLAFLSACQTATGDDKLPNEAVHLASGMLMAGYTSVIATMWSVMDSDAPLVADKVYAQLMVEGKLGNGEAGKALHNAVAGLREQVGEKEFARWVPYIHIGS